MIDISGITIHIDHADIHVGGDLTEVINLLQQIKGQGIQTMADLTSLQDEVAQDTDVTNSAITLLNGLADRLEAALTDPAAVEAIVADLRTNRESLAAAVSENTPAATP